MSRLQGGHVLKWLRGAHVISRVLTSKWLTPVTVSFKFPGKRNNWLRCLPCISDSQWSRDMKYRHDISGSTVVVWSLPERKDNYCKQKSHSKNYLIYKVWNIKDVINRFRHRETLINRGEKFCLICVTTLTVIYYYTNFTYEKTEGR